jgi:hypothetical protein
VSGDIVERLRHDASLECDYVCPDDLFYLADVADEIERLRAEHTFVERLVAGQLSARMAELEADLAAERAEVARLRAALVDIQGAADIFGDGGCACSGFYVRTLDRVWKMADDALPATGGPS